MGISLGTQQGRLSPRPYPGLQAFPHDNWQQEFYLARSLNLESIEWILMPGEIAENPFMKDGDGHEILEISQETGVKVSSVCAPFFLSSNLYSNNPSEREVYREAMNSIIVRSSQLGVKTIVLPVLEEASPNSEDELELLYRYLSDWKFNLSRHDVRIGLEFDICAEKQASIIQNINDPRVGVCFDMGNAAAMGYSATEDMELLGDSIFAVHIKDRKRGGPSVYLGQGDADVAGAIAFLSGKDWDGVLTFETYYEDDPVGTMTRNMATVNRLLRKRKEVV